MVTGGKHRGVAWDIVRAFDAVLHDILGSEARDQGGVEHPETRPEALCRP